MRIGRLAFDPHDLRGDFMGAFAGITIIYVAGQCSQTEMLDHLIAYGWTPFTEGIFAYRPLGDKDMYDWQIKPQSAWLEVYDLFEQKIAYAETASVRLYWQGTERAGSFHFEQFTNQYGVFDRLWTDWDDPTPKLEQCGWVTDQGWYLERIIPAFLTNGIFIEHVIADNYY